MTQSIRTSIALARLDHGANGCKPVTMLFARLTHDNAAEETLRILVRRAGVFRYHETRRQLLAAQTT